MGRHHASVHWQKYSQETFIDQKYHRDHQWSFDGGCSIPASSSPSIVPIPYSKPEFIDPEEAFIASVASCHMLFFLSLAAKQQIVVLEYVDHAEGILGKNEQGLLCLTQIQLNPTITLGITNHGNDIQHNKTLPHSLLDELHQQAHHQCFIANSIRTQISIKATYVGNNNRDNL